MTDAARTLIDLARRPAIAGLATVVLLFGTGCLGGDDVDSQPSMSPTESIMPDATPDASVAPGTPTETVPNPSATAFLRPTSVVSPTPQLRPTAVERVIARAAEEYGVAPQSIAVIFYEQRTWPSTALGCPETGRFYAQIVTNGYEVMLTVDGTVLTYHVDDGGTTIVRCEAGG